ncbi:uncharacterized protein LOC113154170 isoform X3 [Anabas testudineus]|uniref:uncharacterized protein LOC113154170 isoform X3 n=1 Tax=Anabas testudineus TaxID=64144 RepID=UPI000E45C039|nr:uncharacterized protein LOC113154170 isoform X3 [Anabas testudineus]
MEKQKSQLAPEQDALEHIVACRDKPFLEERFIDSFKERGVFTHETIKPSMFVVEYRGKIFGHKNTRPRRKCGDTLTNYVYEFSWKGARWCIDASKEDKTLGRLVNDDHINPNCEMKRIEYEGTPHLCLFAVREIYPGEEITYNYGDSSYPWRSKAFCEGSSASNTDLHTTSSTPTNKKFEEASSNEGSCSDDDDDELPDSGSNSGSDGDYKPDEKVLGSDEESSDDDNLANEDTEKPEPSSYSRRNYCYVCGKGMTKIARHLFIHADEEPDITKVLALPKKSKERKRLLNDLRNRGNYKHNQEVLRTNSGDLKPKRHPKNSSLNGKTYVHCLHCKGMFCRKEIWRHMARCPKKNADSAKPGKARESESDLSESLWYEKYPSEMQKMLLKMKQDEIAFAVNNDHLLIQWAQYLVGKYADNRKMHQYFSKKLRQMGRLLLTLYEKSIFSFEDALKPQNFYKVVEAVRHNAGFDEKKKSYKNPSIALKLVQSLKQIANVVLKGSDNGEEMVRSTKKFLTMCAEEWCDLVSHNAHTSKYKRQINRPSTIPFTHDVQAFYKHLETISASATETMKKYESPQVYNALCRVTLAQVSVLNKGTPEVSKVTLKSFQEREETTQVLSKHFIRINIPSKTGQNVAVLLTSELVNAITLLVSKRKSCGVHKDNLFLFAKPDGSASSFYYGGGCLKSFSNLCHAKNPEYLRSTYFQKHITRVFQILNLENDELDHLSKLLGLTIRTERDYYRLPEAAEELAKIAKLLLAMEKGSFERVKGNSLDEIEIEDQLEPDVEQVYSKYCDAEEDKESDALPQQSDDVDQQVSHPDPEQDALEHIKASKDKAFLEGICIDPFKGRGLFTHESIEPSTFVVEYRGKCFTREDSQKNKCGDSLNKYLFDFSWKGTNWCIDASSDDGSLGRLVNDDHISPNCEVKKIVCEGKPHLCLFAIKKIFAGEEITYNYGDSSCPWRSTGEDLSSAESGCDDTGDVFDDDQRSDDDLTSNNNKLDLKKKNPDFAEAHSSEQQPIDDSFIQQEDETHQEEKPSYTNRNYCYICGKAQSKISRHLFTHRHEDAEIAEIFALRRNSKERKSRLEKLRDKGNCKHNEEVLKTRRGELKVRKRQLNRATAARTFVPCIYCKVMFGRTTIWHHLQKCSLKNISKPPKGVGPKILTVVAATVTDSQEIPSDVKELVQTLKEDKVTSVVSKDSYILQLAQCLCHESKGKKRRYEYVRTKLRQMGRLLLLLKEKAVGSFEEAMKPANYSKVVEAVRKLTGFSEEGKSCDTPSLLLKLVKSLEVIGGIKYARAVKEDDQERMQEAETFLALCAKEWSGFTDSDVKANSVSAIPFTHDVQLVYQHLEKTAASGVQTLTTYESPPVYNALLRVTFAQLSVLNKYAPDISNITLQSFIERQETELHEDAIGCQSQLEQILRKRFVTIQVTSRRDKKCRGKKCALVLSPELLTAITLLVSKREVCGVNKKNPFLFARPNGVYTSVYRGQKCINILMDWSGAKNPQTLRSPFFFKHMARIFHILSLSNSELDQLSKLLERNIRTDWEYYRMPEAAGDIVKILQLLSAMEKGSFERFEGKTLEEIEVEDELQPEMEENNPETSDGEEDNLEAQSSLHPSDTGNETNTTQGRHMQRRFLLKRLLINQKTSFASEEAGPRPDREVGQRR